MTVHAADCSGRGKALRLGLSMYTYLIMQSCCKHAGYKINHCMYIYIYGTYDITDNCVFLRKVYFPVKS